MSDADLNRRGTSVRRWAAWRRHELVGLAENGEQIIHKSKFTKSPLTKRRAERRAKRQRTGR